MAKSVAAPKKAAKKSHSSKNKMLIQAIANPAAGALAPTPVASFISAFSPATGLGGITLQLQSGQQIPLNNLSAANYTATINVLRGGSPRYNGQYLISNN